MTANNHATHITPKGSFDLLGPAFEAFKLNVGPLLFVVFLPLVAMIILGLLAIGLLFAGASAAGSWNDASNTGFIAILSFITIFAILFLIMSFILYAMQLLIQLQSVRGHKITIGQSFNSLKGKYLRLVGNSLIVGILVGVGLLLLVFPGLYLFRKYCLSPYFIIDKNAGVFESLTLSAEVTKQYSGAIWGTIGVFVLIAILGIAVASVIPFLGNIFSSLVMVVAAMLFACRYQEMVAHNHSGHTSTTHTSAASPLS